MCCLDSTPLHLPHLTAAKRSWGKKAWDAWLAQVHSVPVGLPVSNKRSITKGIKNPSALKTDLLHDAFLIIVTEGSAQLVIVHGWTVLLNTPQPGYLWNKSSKCMNVCEPNPRAKEHYPADSLFEE